MSDVDDTSNGAPFYFVNLYPVNLSLRFVFSQQPAPGSGVPAAEVTLEGYEYGATSAWEYTFAPHIAIAVSVYAACNDSLVMQDSVILPVHESTVVFTGTSWPPSTGSATTPFYVVASSFAPVTQRHATIRLINLAPNVPLSDMVITDGSQTVTVPNVDFSLASSWEVVDVSANPILDVTILDSASGNVVGHTRVSTLPETAVSIMLVGIQGPDNASPFTLGAVPLLDNAPVEALAARAKKEDETMK